MIEAKKLVIDANGYLLVQREHDSCPHPMYCPHGAAHHSGHCGEHCVLFGDIKKMTLHESTYEEPHKDREVFVLSIECGDFANIHNIHAPDFVRDEFRDLESEASK